MDNIHNMDNKTQCRDDWDNKDGVKTLLCCPCLV